MKKGNHTGPNRPAKINILVLPIPNKDGFMICTQYGTSTMIHTDNNGGNGYSEEQAILKAQSIRGSDKS